MAKPAARKGVDTAGHAGPITTGSPNVFIGGAPAARQGDSFTCTDPEHGSGVIIGGSGTVFINGMPAARMGDATQCNSAASPAGEAAAIGGPASTRYDCRTIVPDSNEDGTVKTKNPDNLEMSILRLCAVSSDTSGRGEYDTSQLGGEFMNVDAKGRTGEEGGWGVGIDGGFSVLKVDTTVGETIKENEHASIEELKGTGITFFKGGVNAGKEDTAYAKAQAELDLGYVERTSKRTSFSEGGSKFGGEFKESVEGAAANLEVGGQIKFSDKV